MNMNFMRIIAIMLAYSNFATAGIGTYAKCTSDNLEDCYAPHIGNLKDKSEKELIDLRGQIYRLNNKRGMFQRLQDWAFGSKRATQYKALKKDIYSNLANRLEIETDNKASFPDLKQAVSKGLEKRASTQQAVVNADVQKVAEPKAQIDASAHKITELEATNAELLKTIDELNAQLQAKKGFMSLANIAKITAQYKNQIAEQKNQIAFFEAELQNYQSKIKELEDIIAVDYQAEFLQDECAAEPNPTDDQEFASSFVMVENNNAGSLAAEQSSLVKIDEKTKEYRFDDVLSEQVYKDLLELVDLSYAIAKQTAVLNPVADEKAVMAAARQTNIEAGLAARGWSKPVVFVGATGKDNCEKDDTGIMSYNLKSNIIVVAFHGSRNGSMIGGAFYNNGQGDWGANYDFEPVAGKQHNLKYIKEDIQVHRGYANNLSSAQDDLFAKLEKTMENFGGKTPWVIVTGHSKGGAMAQLATPILKLFLRDKKLPARVACAAFSPPRVFHGDVARSWFHMVVGKRNNVRFSVYGDPATQVPRKSLGYEYRSVGLLALDTIAGVDKRIEAQLGSATPNGYTFLANRGWFDVRGWVGRYHYGFERDGGVGFEPKMLPSYAELLDCLSHGQEHVGEGLELNQSTLWKSMNWGNFSTRSLAH
jgi:hypothetical protein